MKNPAAKEKTDDAPVKKYNLLQMGGWIIVWYGVTTLFFSVMTNLSEFQAYPSDFVQILFETVFSSMPALLIGGILLLLSGHKNANKMTKILTYLIGAVLVLAGLYFLYVIYALMHFQF